MFRGREMQHPELGRKILDQVAEAVVDQGRVEVYPRLDGRNMTMVLGPDKKAQAAAEKRRQAESEEADTRHRLRPGRRRGPGSVRGPGRARGRRSPTDPEPQHPPPAAEPAEAADTAEA